LSGDHEWLFAVNAGSNLFLLKRTMMKPDAGYTESSEGKKLVSVSVHGPAGVLNFDSALSTASGRSGGTLTLSTDLQSLLSGREWCPADFFTPNGNLLIVTEKQPIKSVLLK
jgi:hypothetical protein